jgi:hypothetical protein
VKNDVTIVCLQESKLPVVTVADVVQCCGADFTEFASVPTVGTRGGIILTWRED